ncbi:NHL repeat-containing protein [Tunicatimonas pelagia]|uniref:NHL repeat-containing protein n=1 Tax=Tunicatimonas pelagia TaxID=931531 RepID=UPI00266597E1|nr:NHL repeat-containing protein [Tunicatimonas pelagia]WKN44804.1 NHL repeat-containing protein [Tunicatimonas pelagia]
MPKNRPTVPYHDTAENMNITTNYSRTRLLLISLLATIWFASCGRTDWQETATIDVQEHTPIGLVLLEEALWISDGDNNQLVKLTQQGDVEAIVADLDRPMHLDTDGESLIVPEYGSDRIVKITGNSTQELTIPDSLDAPAGVSVLGNEMVIADFYNHRVLYSDGKSWQSFGKKGSNEGEFNYPTDVQVTPDKIYVADAYNHRVQVFDKSGAHLQTIGQRQQMNAATGIFVSDNELFVTDFENNRVLIFDLAGNLLQTISDKLDKPTDIVASGNRMWITNYGGRNVTVYKR